MHVYALLIDKINETAKHRKPYFLKKIHLTVTYCHYYLLHGNLWHTVSLDSLLILPPFDGHRLTPPHFGMWHDMDTPDCWSSFEHALWTLNPNLRLIIYHCICKNYRYIKYCINQKKKRSIKNLSTYLKTQEVVLKQNSVALYFSISSSNIH